MPSIIQNAVYVPELQSHFVAPEDSTSRTIPLNDGKVLIIGGGLESAWRASATEGDYIKIIYADRYIDFCLTDEYPVEVIRDKLLWTVRNGPDEVAVLIKDMSYEALIDLLDEVTTWPSTHHYGVVQYWAETKEAKHLSGN